MFLASIQRQEKACTFNNNIGTHFVPFQVGWVSFCGQTNSLAVHHEIASTHRNIALELAVYRIMLKQVSQIIWLEQIIDGYYFNISKILDCCAKHHTTDAAETIDTHFDCHLISLALIQ